MTCQDCQHTRDHTGEKKKKPRLDAVASVESILRTATSSYTERDVLLCKQVGTTWMYRRNPTLLYLPGLSWLSPF